MFKNIVKLAAVISLLSTSSTVFAASGSLTVGATATIKSGSCYFDSTHMDFDFGEKIYPSEVVNGTATATDTTQTTEVKSGSERHLGCDTSSTKMKFNVDAGGHQGLADDGTTLITLSTSATEEGDSASGFGIALYYTPVDADEIPLVIGEDTDVGDQGGFTLTARLKPLQGKTAKDITSGYISAQAILNITYE